MPSTPSGRGNTRGAGPATAQVRYLDESELRAALPMNAAIDALGQALIGTRDHPLEIAPRTVVSMSGNGPEAGDEMLRSRPLGRRGRGQRSSRSPARTRPADCRSSKAPTYCFPRSVSRPSW